MEPHSIKTATAINFLIAVSASSIQITSSPHFAGSRGFLVCQIIVYNRQPPPPPPPLCAKLSIFITWRNLRFLPSMFVAQCVCDFVCYLPKSHDFGKYVSQFVTLSSCFLVFLFVCSRYTGHSFQAIRTVLHHHHLEVTRKTPQYFGDPRSKVKVKVTQNMKNTYLAITLEPDKLETSG